MGLKTHCLAAAILADDAGNGRHECDFVVSVADVRSEAANAADLHRVDARHGDVRRVSRLVRIVISSKKRFKTQKEVPKLCVSQNSKGALLGNHMCVKRSVKREQREA